MDFVLTERECCPFFTSELAFEPEGGSMWLHLRGSFEIKSYVENVIGRIAVGRSEIDWSVAWRFVAGAIPSAIVGSVAFAHLSIHWLSALLGIFLLLTVVYRHSRFNQTRMPLTGFVPLGLVFGFLSAVLGSVGPFVAPWFLAYGLVKTAYVSTEALGALAMHLTKTLAYGKLSLLTGWTIMLGLALSPAMIAGSYLGKLLVGRIPEHVFQYLIEAVLILAGIQFLLEGLFHVA